MRYDHIYDLVFKFSGRCVIGRHRRITSDSHQINLLCHKWQAHLLTVFQNSHHAGLCDELNRKLKWLIYT